MMHRPQKSWMLVGLAFLFAALGLALKQHSPTLAAARVVIRANNSDPATPVIQHPASQEFPDVDQQRVVWQDFRFGPTDIFMADLQTHTIVNLTQTDTWEVQPDLDGNIVVWKDGYHGIGIHGRNMATGQTFTVTEGHADTSRPRLSGNIVVWADNRAGVDDWNIYGYDLTKRTEFVIADAPGNQHDPQIDDNLVVWWDDNWHILLYDLATQQTMPIPGVSIRSVPDVSAVDHLVVWQDNRNGNSDIYGYDLTAQTEKPIVVEPEDQENVAIANGLVAFQSRVLGVPWNIQLHVLASDLTFVISENSNPQTQPAVNGATVVWQDNRSHQADIYQFAWTGVVPPIITHPVAAPSNLQVGAFPAGKIYLQWQDNALNETGLKIERAQGITGTNWTEIAALPANTTVYTDTPGVLDESYWYRVRAYNAQGVSVDSNESFNATFADTPTPAEWYLMTLINEARAAPGAFGYPAYPPVPPLAYNPLVAYSAHSHSQSILNSVFQFGHCDPIGRCPTERARAVGYHNPAGCSENLTTGDTGAAAIEGANKSFLDSAGHRDNMLNSDAKEFGVGHTYDIEKGESYRHGQFTEVFCAQPGLVVSALPTGAVMPYTGTLATIFTYVVNFYSSAGLSPTKAQVFIDDIPHGLTLSTGTAALGTYRYSTALAVGQHQYYFLFQYGQTINARWPQTGALAYPAVYDPDQPWTPTPAVTATPPTGTSAKFQIHLPLVKR